MREGGGHRGEGREVREGGVGEGTTSILGNVCASKASVTVNTNDGATPRPGVSNDAQVVPHDEELVPQVVSPDESHASEVMSRDTDASHDKESPEVLSREVVSRGGVVTELCAYSDSDDDEKEETSHTHTDTDAALSDTARKPLDEVASGQSIESDMSEPVTLPLADMTSVTCLIDAPAVSTGSELASHMLSGGEDKSEGRMEGRSRNKCYISFRRPCCYSKHRCQPEVC